MMQDSSMSDMIRQMMEQKKSGGGSGEGFNMMGQYTSTVKQEQAPDGSSREYVLYDDGNGNEIKVYGNWNEYAQGQDEEGNMFLPDEDFPVMKNENGDYVLDERRFEDTMSGVEGRQKARGMARNLGGPGASPMEDLMQRLSDAPGPRKYSRGGKFPDLNKDGKVTFADILKGRGVNRR
jgi:hypothetical protein